MNVINHGEASCPVSMFVRCTIIAPGLESILWPGSGQLRGRLSLNELLQIHPAPLSCSKKSCPRPRGEVFDDDTDASAGTSLS